MVQYRRSKSVGPVRFNVSQTPARDTASTTNVAVIQSWLAPAQPSPHENSRLSPTRPDLDIPIYRSTPPAVTSVKSELGLPLKQSGDRKERRPLAVRCLTSKDLRRSEEAPSQAA
jgi:hypothetical protein